MTARTLRLDDGLAVRVYDGPRPAAAPIVRPSVGEYQAYDEQVYQRMTADRIRSGRYEAAIRRHARGAVALDIGTGADLNWARACLDAGARTVYAIEELDGSYRAAQALARRLGIGDRLQLIHGAAAAVALPERVDLCVSEIIGTIGSSEGVRQVLRDARQRFLAPRGVMIPERCVTRVAAIALPQPLHAQPAFESRHVADLRRVFAHAGRPFDVTLCLERPVTAYLRSTDDVFEEIDFTGDIALHSTHCAELRITRSGRIDGLLLWIHLWCLNDQPVMDSLRETAWTPVFWPTFYPGIDVEEGDIVVMRCEVRPSETGPFPDYRVDGEVRRAASTVPFQHAAPHHGTTFRGSAFYQRLFPR